jgi:general secretion pathway protein F
MQFLVRVFDTQQAQMLEQTVAGTSQQAVVQQLTDQGHVVLSVHQVGKGLFASASTRQAPLDVAWWCKELRTLLSAGMTVVEALETLHAQPLGAARARVHAVLVNELRQGKTLSAAMLSTGQFPAVLVASVKASERTSAMVSALDDYLKYHEMLEQMRKKLVSAAIYPAVVLGLGLAIVMFLLLYVIPRFSRMYADLHGATSLATRILVQVSAVLAQHGASIVAALGGVALALAWAWQRGVLQQGVAAVAAGIPWLQRQMDEFRLAKLYQSLGLMFKGGYALDEALGQCASLGLGARMTAGIHSAQSGLARGQRVSTALAQAGLTDAVSQRLLAVGERTGNFERVLQTIAERHGNNFATFIDRATRVVEPLLLMLVALVVGGIVVMMYMPVFDIASSVR